MPVVALLSVKIAGSDRPLFLASRRNRADRLRPNTSQSSLFCSEMAQPEMPDFRACRGVAHQPSHVLFGQTVENSIPAILIFRDPSLEKLFESLKRFELVD